MGDFEKLFFEFNDKKFDPNILLTKEEFYTYTVKIAAFSDRLAALYPKEKEVAAESKKKWLSESYEVCGLYDVFGIVRLDCLE